MSNVELIKELRNRTQAGMKDCSDALKEANYDLEKATDLVKAKGLANTSRNASKAAAEGRLVIDVPVFNPNLSLTMVETNCNTDFVANGKEFQDFTSRVGDIFAEADLVNGTDDVLAKIEPARQELMALTRENVVVRRWWRMEMGADSMVCSYLHGNAKIGVLISLSVPQKTIEEHAQQLLTFGDSVAMQIAAMNPLTVSKDQLSSDDLARQQGIFEVQLAELNKPKASWPKIMEGKTDKWCKEVCLLNQESITTPKTSVGDLLKQLSIQVGAEVKIVKFIRAVVGEGIEVQKTDLAADVAGMIGSTPLYPCPDPHAT